mmetsp:Transcript_10418/g.10453  ORF Transcript_10418/g.10453 Transcript_10418/m.10453 type:complete len:134 (-) Transcript_10418:27-428(-)|eukprot:CAMPEP_0170566504 /NCGR_PEP_ID=MMETSP0211-20121228/79879_1 /TAXON_ID=311385 /ORGANISM="Pseudokeronopsis sp., Strain OXSARD2" /LENGTH=133 /DNA_ID=CAMNT_0010887703 /DNA_START=2166 /DNA_END=2567 /DNA_ORIENTATION=-
MQATVMRYQQPSNERVVKGGFSSPGKQHKQKLIEQLNKKKLRNSQRQVNQSGVNFLNKNVEGKQVALMVTPSKQTRFFEQINFDPMNYESRDSQEESKLESIQEVYSDLKGEKILNKKEAIQEKLEKMRGKSA